MLLNQPANPRAKYCATLPALLKFSFNIPNEAARLRSEQNISGDPMIIDCHGHYTSEPPAFLEFRKQQVAAFGTSSAAPAIPQITDDQIREKLEPAQLKFQRDRGTDLTIFSPRASGMGHHVGDAKIKRGVVSNLQRHDPPHRESLPKKFHRRLPVAAIHGRAARNLHPGAGALREGVRIRRLQSESGSIGRLVEGAAAHRQMVVSRLRKNGGTGSPCDGPRDSHLQSRISHDGFALHQRRYDRLHAIPYVRFV